MTQATERVTQLFEGVKRKHKQIITPEGVALDVQIAGGMERLYAFAIDILIMGITIFILFMGLLWLLFFRTNISVGLTLFLFLAFIVRIFYFLHFELAWQGRTPGKKMFNLRVINRYGGELTPSALIARNLTREVEFFLPLTLFALMDSGSVNDIVLFLWVMVLAALPLFNREHLRAGDLIGGTMVIAMPKRILLNDLSFSSSPVQLGRSAFIFTPQQLAIYGTFELQILEEFLRRPPNLDTQQLLEQVCQKICRKINWSEPVHASQVRQFLMDFYAAERGSLERGQLFGKVKEDKFSGDVPETKNAPFPVNPSTSGGSVKQPDPARIPTDTIVPPMADRPVYPPHSSEAPVYSPQGTRQVYSVNTGYREEKGMPQQVGTFAQPAVTPSTYSNGLEFSRYQFSIEQLNAYGAYELGVLDGILQMPEGERKQQLLEDVCRKISAKIGLRQAVPPEEAHTFLIAFSRAKHASIKG